MKRKGKRSKSRGKPSSRPKFCFGVGGRAKGQARLGFGEKQGKMRCRRQVFTIKFQINALSEHNKKLAQKPNLQNPNFHYKNLRKFGLVLVYLDYLEKQGRAGAFQTKIYQCLISGKKKFLGLAPRKNFHEKFPEKISSSSFFCFQLRKFVISKNLWYNIRGIYFGWRHSKPIPKPISKNEYLFRKK